VRPIPGLDRRLTEASRLGFHRVVASTRSTARLAGLTHFGLTSVDELVGTLAA
jgi:predicted ATP-dependent serine protease